MTHLARPGRQVAYPPADSVRRLACDVAGRVDGRIGMSGSAGNARERSVDEETSARDAETKTRDGAHKRTKGRRRGMGFPGRKDQTLRPRTLRVGEGQR